MSDRPLVDSGAPAAPKTVPVTPSSVSAASAAPVRTATDPAASASAAIPAGSSRRRTSYGVVVLTMGSRPDDLARGLDSLLGQRDVDLDVVVVGNGWQPVGLPPGVRGYGLPENLGIPAGRNAGVPLVQGDLLFFLDDDASLPNDTVLSRMAALFAADPELGLIQPRVVDPDGRPAPRRWTPRLRVGDPGRSSPAMSVWEGAVALTLFAFYFSVVWPKDFWYAHDGI